MSNNSINFKQENSDFLSNSNRLEVPNNSVRESNTPSQVLSLGAYSTVNNYNPSTRSEQIRNTVTTSPIELSSRLTNWMKSLSVKPFSTAFLCDHKKLRNFMKGFCCSDIVSGSLAGHRTPVGEPSHPWF